MENKLEALTTSTFETQKCSMEDLLTAYAQVMKHINNTKCEYYLISESLSNSEDWQKEMKERSYILSNSVWRHPTNLVYNFSVWPDNYFPNTLNKESDIIKYNPKAYIDSIMDKEIKINLLEEEKENE